MIVSYIYRACDGGGGRTMSMVVVLCKLISEIRVDSALRLRRCRYEWHRQTVRGTVYRPCQFDASFQLIFLCMYSRV